MEQKQQTEKQHSAETAALIRKYRRQLWLSCVSGLISLGVLVGASLAWFASNRQVRSTGMAAQIEITSNLIISATREGLASHETSVAFETNARPLIPARHWDGVSFDDGVEIDPKILLYYNSDPEDVSIDTGLAGSEKNLTFAPVKAPEEGKESPYFMDFQLYLAAAGKSIQAVKLELSMTADSAEEENRPAYFNASSIDVYLGGTYYATVNAAGKNWQDHMDLPGQTLVLNLAENSGKTPITFPVADENGSNAVPLLLRCYFDGGLKSDENHTYVNTTQVTGNIGCTMTFRLTAEEKAS